MTDLKQLAERVLRTPDRFGVLGTASREGQPNIAVVSSTRLTEDGSLAVALGDNMSLKNLEENPQAVYFTAECGPMRVDTPGFRLYLLVREIQRDGPVLDTIREFIGHLFSPEAAALTVAAVIFEVTEVRPMVDWSYRRE